MQTAVKIKKQIRQNKTMNTLPTKGAFEAQVNTNFKMFVDENAFDLTLVEFKSIISNQRQECYSLLFHAPQDAPVYQSMFRLEHETLGAMDIFLVPVKKDEGGIKYEAVFNNLLA